MVCPITCKTILADYLNPFGTFMGGIATFLLFLFSLKPLSNWKNQKLIEKRLAFFDKHFDAINTIYTYCIRVGSASREKTPVDILNLKRESDKAVHLARVLFS
ncbi:MAG: hypothetical protein ACKO34_05245, partial [Vampirovibrionales bacterium]